MTDLRDRIAAALESADRIGYGTRPYGELADAVIAELGLHREGTESRTVTNEFGATYRVEGGYRYVTKWESNDG
jgi:hypothetical protein